MIQVESEVVILEAIGNLGFLKSHDVVLFQCWLIVVVTLGCQIQEKYFDGPQMELAIFLYLTFGFLEES